MLLPYNVDRPLRRTPYITYVLLGLNIFIYFMTVLVSNTNLPADRSNGRELIRTLLMADNVATVSPDESPSFLNSADTPISEKDQSRALAKVIPRLNTREGVRDLYLIRNVNEKVVWEPHYSILNTFAYRAIEPSPWLKLLGLFGSMFLHGGMMHLAGNMFSLWVFGRALEEFLGYKFYAAVYLVCGVAATLLYHIASIILTPQSMGVPLVGASGAIAGVMGLFAVRFYRTKVRVFYLTILVLLAIPIIGPIIGVAIFLALLLLVFIAFLFVGSWSAAAILVLLPITICLIVFGRNWAWGAFRAPSMWVIGIYIFFFNIVPIIMDTLNREQSGTAYWAHLGGFACGALYAFLIGGIDEGKHEYELEDVQTALHKTGAGDALDRAMRFLAKEPENPQAHEVAALAYLNMQHIEAATPHFVNGIIGYSRRADRPNATRLYSIISPYNSNVPLPAPILASIAGEFTKNNNWDEAAAVLVRVIEEFPATTEAEVALLRAAQIWMRQYQDPYESARMLETFLATYPASTYIPQAEAALASARQAIQEQNSAGGGAV